MLSEPVVLVGGSDIQYDTHCVAKGEIIAKFKVELIKTSLQASHVINFVLTHKIRAGLWTQHNKHKLT